MKKKLKDRAALLILVLLITAAAVNAGACGRSTESRNEPYEQPQPPLVSGTNDEEPPEPDENPKTPDLEEFPKPPVTVEEEDGDIILSPIEENSIVLTAQSLIGIPFRDGGSSPEEGFDNSGFIFYVLRRNGYVNCPRALHEQSNMGNKINSISELKSGDLVFFSDNGERAGFGGIYIGDGIMISCRMPGETVREFDITTQYYRGSFFTGVRVL
ncbi:MAG: C40 family peptidase [Oscillospiraceae bacterium]|jgi:cell wall-associated NlpC family hydrolase|nr:C40 family peptidase [Oscillospiraceae bacterium]